MLTNLFIIPLLLSFWGLFYIREVFPCLLCFLLMFSNVKWCFIVVSLKNRRGIQQNMVYIDDQRVMMKYLFPLNEIVVDFYDLLKSMSSGYARYKYASATKCWGGTVPTSYWKKINYWNMKRLFRNSDHRPNKWQLLVLNSLSTLVLQI